MIATLLTSAEYAVGVVQGKKRGPLGDHRTDSLCCASQLALGLSIIQEPLIDDTNSNEAQQIRVCQPWTVYLLLLDSFLSALISRQQPSIHC